MLYNFTIVWYINRRCTKERCNVLDALQIKPGRMITVAETKLPLLPLWTTIYQLILSSRLSRRNQGKMLQNVAQSHGIPWYWIGKWDTSHYGHLLGKACSNPLANAFEAVEILEITQMDELENFIRSKKNLARIAVIKNVVGFLVWVLDDRNAEISKRLWK